MSLPHTYTSLLVHGVFSTKDRRPIITEEMQQRLWPYMGGIARQHKMKALAIGGTDDHAHVLLSLPATMCVAEAMKLIKGGSSKWMNDTLHRRWFAWQENYSAFTIGVSQIAATVRYINNQKSHHTKMNFDQELKKILARHGMTEIDR